MMLSKPARHRGERKLVSPPVDDKFLTQPIDYVDHPAFHRPRPERRLQAQNPLPDQCAEATTLPGVTFVAGFVSAPLLTAAEEESLFAWMNFHRFRAEQLRRKALKSAVAAREMARIRRELALSHELRNRIVSSNLRLVVALAKKLSRSLDHMSELISEGVLPLIRSVELFDISLGNRFSTYATWAVRNQMLRCIKRAGQPLVACQNDANLEVIADQRPEVDLEHVNDSRMIQVQSLLAELPDRERLVLRARFGLSGEPAGQSLAEVADRVGLSKERVRQIVLQTLENLRQRLDFNSELSPNFL